MLEQKVLDYIHGHEQEARELLITLAQIPPLPIMRRSGPISAGNGWRKEEQRGYLSMKLSM